jgi:hypothetical protein
MINFQNHKIEEKKKTLLGASNMYGTKLWDHLGIIWVTNELFSFNWLASQEGLSIKW